MIRSARLAAGLTQAELARRLGVTQPAIAALERPGANPRFDTVTRTLAQLGEHLQPVTIARALPTGVDPTLIRSHLRLTMGERIRGVDRMRADADALSTAIRRR